MTKNNAINEKIIELIETNRDCILQNRGTNDKKSVTYDGIVKEGNERPEILFLLKEPNDGRDSSKKQSVSPDDKFNFAETMCKEAKSQENDKPQKWPNLCYWTQSYYDALEGTPRSFNHAVIQKCGGRLGDIAFVNIKKVAGTSKVEKDEFNKTVRNIKLQKLIRDEIDLINPRIVVCCGTFEYAINYIFKDYIQIEGELDCGVKFFIYENIYFVDFIHPSQQGAAARYSMSYAYAKEVFKDVVNLMKAK